MKIEVLFDQKTGHKRISTLFFKSLIVPNFIQKEENFRIPFSIVRFLSGLSLCRSCLCCHNHYEKTRKLKVGRVER